MWAFKGSCHAGRSLLLCKLHMSQNPSHLFQALRKLIRPLARFCFKHNIRIQEFEEVAKLSFLDVAEEEIKLKNESVSQSRLSVITGLHRRDVNRLYVQESEPKLSHNLLTRVIGHWRSAYSHKNGNPIRLSLEGRPSEFMELVWSISKDANPYAVMFELERSGLVRRVDDKVELIARGFIPSKDFELGFSLLARDSNDLLLAVEENVIDGIEPANLHLTTEYDNLSESDFKSVRKWLLDEGAKIHLKIGAYLAKLDRDATPSKQRDTPAEKRLRVAFSSFSRVHLLNDCHKWRESQEFYLL